MIVICVSLAAAKKKSVPAQTDARHRAIHALNRLSFGPRPGDVDRVLATGVDKWMEQQLHPEKINDSALDARLAPFRTLKMDTRAMLENFPPPPVIKAVADGRLPMPRDPTRRAIYEAQLERYRGQQMRKQDAGAQGDGDEDRGLSREARMYAAIEAERMAGLPADKRFEQIMKMSPGERAALAKALPPGQRMQLLSQLTPEQRETVMALGNPAQVVASELQQAKVLRAIYGERQFEEVMTDFWFNHFNVFLGKGADHYLVTSYERDAIRPHVLGKFKDLLLASARHPAMLFYLDNWMSAGPNSEFAVRGAQRMRRRPVFRGEQAAPSQRRVSGLNENYARELMELHTLGADGGYTQKDVTEVARVFTGWTIREPRRGGGYEFNQRRHEPGAKTVLGRTIREDGEKEGIKVLEMLARHPSTARFISTKLAQRFVSDDPPPALVERMAKVFREEDGDIREVLRAMFRSPEFWSPDAYRAKVKTPLEFIASAVRASGAETDEAMSLVQALNRMGMPLYGAQPPTGYSTRADAWVNSSDLLNRMNFALALANGKLPGVKIDAGRIPVSADGDRVLAHLEHEFFAGDVSKPTHDTVLKQLDQQAAPHPGVLAGLLLGSPEFQRK